MSDAVKLTEGHRSYQTTDEYYIDQQLDAGEARCADEEILDSLGPFRRPTTTESA